MIEFSTDFSPEKSIGPRYQPRSDTKKESAIYLGKFAQQTRPYAREGAGSDGGGGGGGGDGGGGSALSSTLRGFPFCPISLLYQFPIPDDSISRAIL